MHMLFMGKIIMESPMINMSTFNAFQKLIRNVDEVGELFNSGI